MAEQECPLNLLRRLCVLFFYALLELLWAASRKIVTWKTYRKVNKRLSSIYCCKEDKFISLIRTHMTNNNNIFMWVLVLPCHLAVGKYWWMLIQNSYDYFISSITVLETSNYGHNIHNVIKQTSLISYNEFLVLDSLCALFIYDLLQLHRVFHLKLPTSISRKRMELFVFWKNRLIGEVY